MTGDLLQALVCPPSSAGWDRPLIAGAWRELGFHAPPNFDIAREQHDSFCYILSEARVEVVCLPLADSLTLDAVYVNDSSLMTDEGLILMHPGKVTRRAEANSHARCCSRVGIDVIGEIQAPGISEAGDFLWLDANTLMVGQGYRTNKAAVKQMNTLLGPTIEIIPVQLPYSSGPSACLHLTSLMSMLDERTILVDLPWLAVEVVELLADRGYRLIEIDPRERDSLAPNVLSLGNNRLVAIEENVSTNRRLRNLGFEVQTFPGSEICINGCGGPTCLTRPLARRGSELSLSKSPEAQTKAADNLSHQSSLYVS
jgi:N-dimethylarginine dimethylaminohydrolase